MRRSRHLVASGVWREDSDDELGSEDLLWEWIYAGGDKQPEVTEKADSLGCTWTVNSSLLNHGDMQIAGARIGTFECRKGDAVLLKADGNEAWVGIITHFFEAAENGEKFANFMWFSTHREIRNKAAKRLDMFDNELYITPSFDDNPLNAINGRATIMSAHKFFSRYPKGVIQKTSRDYGKVFICRRGCNTRTAAYTEEFVWENIYSGPKDVSSLVEIVEGLKRHKRRIEKPQNEASQHLLDADLEPLTPSKHRRPVSEALSSTHEENTEKYSTPSGKRVRIKRPLSFTPLGTRVKYLKTFSSPFQTIRGFLHVAAVPTALPCREEQFASIYSHLRSAIIDGTGTCIYISGTPGTGKTATVKEVMAQLNLSVMADEMDDFIYVEVNGMRVPDPHHSYAMLWEALHGDRVSPSHALNLLQHEFSSPNPRRVPCVVLMDELDQLITKNQSVMYNFFNWPGLQHSRLIVIAVANTMDLPERTLSNKISSRLGLIRITFPGYTHEQLMHIIESRLLDAPKSLVSPDAVQFAARKVAAVSGDARRALDICRRAVEIAEENFEKTVDQNGPIAGHDDELEADQNARSMRKGVSGAKVTISMVKQAIAEATNSPLQQCIRSLPKSSRFFLDAVVGRMRRLGCSDVHLGDVVEDVKQLCLLGEIQFDRGTLEVETCNLTAPRDSNLSQFRKKRSSGAIGVNTAAVELADVGLITLEAARGDRVARVRLNISVEEVRLALGDERDSGVIEQTRRLDASA